MTRFGVHDAAEVLAVCAAAARRRLGVIGAVSPWPAGPGDHERALLAPAGPAETINTSRSGGTPC
jgi:hypothetical protein